MPLWRFHQQAVLRRNAFENWLRRSRGGRSQERRVTSGTQLAQNKFRVRISLGPAMCESGRHGICYAFRTMPPHAWELLMTNESQSKTMPTLFIPHGGGPCFFMDWNPPDTWKKMGSWLASLPGTVGVMPKAIVVISGHWESPEFAVTGSAHPPLIYDYQGFPPHTYQLRYDVPGAPQLAQQIVDLLGGAGLPARVDPERGFDHGVFIPFKVIYPRADVPIVQLSLKVGLDPKTHLEIGRALQPLRKQ